MLKKPYGVLERLFVVAAKLPADFVVGAPLQVVDEVSWFEVKGDGSSTWFAVDRGTYVALTLPQGSGPTPIQLMSRTIAQVMPAQPLNPAPPR